MTWQVFYASAAGTSHLDRGLPCQDACEVWQGGDVLIAAVADGAGSGSRSELGSALCVRSVVEALRVHLESLKCGPDDVDIVASSKSLLPDIISRVRGEIIDLADSHSLKPSDLACTLVGVVAKLPDSGYFFHIGDGSAAAKLADEQTPEVVSPPENGEYANETWFVTVDDWRIHLRITPFNRLIELIVVMTDGVMPFAMTRKPTRLFADFINPVTAYLKQNSVEQGNLGLLSILSSDRTKSITNDDKTLVVAFPVS